MRPNSPDSRQDPYAPVDVLVVGGGIAGYCSALAARQAGASVRLIDRAPITLRGGNARHSRNLRLAHSRPSRLFPGSYTDDELLADLERASAGAGDSALRAELAERSGDLPAWLSKQGVHFEEPGAGNLPWSRKSAFLLGGGKAMINALAARAQRLGVRIDQDARCRGIDSQGEDGFRVPICVGGACEAAQARTLILCSGGYQANPTWLAEHWGPAAERFIVRGMPFADGDLLKTLLARGAAPAGTPGACHLVAVDARSPLSDGGILTRIDGMPWGIVVDGTGRRFHDEGLELGAHRFSLWGRLTAGCPGQRTYLILDATGRERTTPSIYPPIEAETPVELADSLGVDPQALVMTIGAYNRATSGTADPRRHAHRLSPPKSRCALPLKTPPFAAYPIAPGITSTSYGIRVDRRARVMRGDGTPEEGLYAAGTIMAPTLLGTGYLAGVGLTIGAVFGRLAGESAAEYVRAAR